MAYDLDGSSGWLGLSFSPIGSLPFTMSAWFKPDSNTVDGVAVCLANSTGSERYSMRVNGSVAGDPIGAESRSAANAASTANTSTGYSTGAWQHAAAVYASDSSRTAYLNGAGAVTDTTTIAFSTINRLAIGARLATNVAGTFLDGGIADVALWNVALSADEIAALAKGISPLLIRPAALAFYAPLVRQLINLKGAAALSLTGTGAVADHLPIFMPRRSVVGIHATTPTLSVDSSTHGHTSTSPTLSGPPQLAPDSKVSAHSSTSPTLASAAAISPDNITLAHEATSPSLILTALPVTPTVRFHPEFSTVTLGGDGRISSISDLMNLAGMTGSTGDGPIEGKDALGRRYWDFNTDPEGTGTHWMTIATALASLSSQGMSVFVVGRFFSQQSGTILSLGINGSSPPNTGGAVARLTGPGNGLQQRPHAAGITAGSSSTKVGTQLAVVGWCLRPTASGGVRIFYNRNARAPGTVSQVTLATANGAEFGRDANSPAGTYLNAHIYEIIVYQGFNPSDATVDAIPVALADTWGIADITHDVIVEGDSITAGIHDRGIARWLSEPGSASALPAYTRVNMSARSGSGFTKTTTQDPTYRRDLANGAMGAQFFLAGDTPELTIQIGRNDITDDATADAAYNELVAYLYTTTTGVLQRGFRVVVGANIAEGSTLGITSSVLRLRNKILNAQFLTDVHANTGQTYEGKVKIANLGAITFSPKGTVFNDLADTTDTDIYQADGLHPTILGEQLEVSGGDTPQNGYRYALTGSAIPISPDSSTHAHSATSPSISPHATLAPADAVHAHSSTSPVVSAITIAPADAIHAHSSTSPAISFQQSIVVQSSVHAHVATTPSLTSRSSLVVSNAIHSHLLSSPQRNDLAAFFQFF